MVKVDHFRRGLLALIERATHHGRVDVLINSGELFRSLGGYPGYMHGTPFCCDAMEAKIKPRDVLLVSAPTGLE
jgi:hypothetical protein